MKLKSFRKNMIFDNLISNLCWGLVSLFPDRVDIIHTAGDPYLLRFHIKHCNRLPGIYLHHFYRSDSDRDLHNHPWDKSTSFIITGAYKEERCVPRQHQHEPNKPTPIQTKIFKAGMINHLCRTDFHKVTLLKEPIWTLFISKKQVQAWGFWDDENKTFVPQKDYLKNSGTYITNLLGKRKELTEK